MRPSAPPGTIEVLDGAGLGDLGGAGDSGSIDASAGGGSVCTAIDWSGCCHGALALRGLGRRCGFVASALSKADRASGDRLQCAGALLGVADDSSGSQSSDDCSLDECARCGRTEATRFAETPAAESHVGLAWDALSVCAQGPVSSDCTLDR